MKAKTTPAFRDAYAKLNSAQRDAVDTIEGPVMVIAGPGTGKTQVLTLRIANILLKTDTPPDAILALTFTEAGVFAMKSRLASLIGTEAYKIHIHTFHSFCNMLIKEHPSYFPRLVGAESLLPIDAVIIMRGVIESRSWEHLTSFADPYVHVNDIVRTISILKREYISSEALLSKAQSESDALKKSAESYHEKGAHKGSMKGYVQKKLDSLERTIELADAYKRYEAALLEKKRYDFDDMIIEVLNAFTKNKSFLQIVQEEYLYILADEHQDANTSQNALLTLLAQFHNNPNLFLVGDEKQAIYSFQGASLEHFGMFTKQYPSAKIITLTDSYRSGTHILTASHALMSAGGIHPDRNPLLTSQHPEPHHATVTTHAFTTEEYELSWVVEQIAAFIKKGVAPQEIAVLYRNNKDAEVISRFLARASVPHIISTSQDALAHHTMQQLLTFCKACFDTYADRAVAESLFAPWSGLSEGDIHRIVRSARVTHKPYIEILHDLKKVEGIVNTDSVSAFYTLLVKASRVAREQHARDFMSFVLNECGFLKYILSHESAADMLGRVRGLLGVLERHAAQHVGYSTKQFLDDVALYIAYKIPIIKDMPTPTSLQSVRLMTAHGSKGLEFSHVFIVHARDKKWGNTRGRNAFYIPGLEADTDDDERRLLYVALTRAKDAAHLTHASKTIEGNEALPSVFIQDIAAHTTAVQTEQFEAGYAPHASLVAPPRGIPVEDKAFLRALFVDQGLSVTALNNYLVCPWRYFYRNLVRMPDIPNNYLLYGNGVHQGIKEFFDMRTEKALPNKAKLISLASNALTTQGFDVTGLSEAQIRAKDHLSTWYDERKGTWNDVQSISELPIEMMLSIDAPSLSRVLIRGVIDRLDAHTDGTLRVVDYKTGRPKTRNEILGDTKNSTGDYFRQLVFYGLYLKEQGRGSVHESCIDFLEPDTKGRHRYESFDISQNEIEALRVVIASTAEAIYTLSFFDKHCDDDACEYCELRRSLQ